MKCNVPKSYLDLARAVVDTQLGSKSGASNEDVIFSLLSCTYVYSYSALVSFCSAQLYILWNQDSSALKDKYKSCDSFEGLMAGPLKEIKNALKELSMQYNLEPIHTARPELWRHLNELLKNYRDFFLHPNPDHFQKYVGETGNAQWRFASDTASGILEYIYEGCRGEAPKWVNTSGLKSLGFKVVDI